MLLPLWLALYALFFLCAPIYAYLSYRTLSDEDGRLVPALAESRSHVHAKTVPMA